MACDGDYVHSIGPFLERPTLLTQLVGVINDDVDEALYMLLQLL